MKKIATLGPKGTFSDLATQKALAYLTESAEISYYPSIKKAFQQIGKDCDFGVLPIENLLEGFVQPLLDLLASSQVKIHAELTLPIKFSLVGSVNAPLEITKLYAQFVAKGQCLESIESLNSPHIITTESNIESLELARKKEVGSAAIVPSHAVSSDEFPLYVASVADLETNRTRFVLLSRDDAPELALAETNCRTSIVIVDDQDYPGLLEDVIKPLSSRKINLTSLISRPSGDELGKYHFFIDFDGSLQDPEIVHAIDEINRINTVKLLGSYPKA